MSGKRGRLPNDEQPPKTRSKTAKERADKRNNALIVAAQQPGWGSNLRSIANAHRGLFEEPQFMQGLTQVPRGPKERTTLMAAAAHGNLERVKILLNRPDAARIINIADSDGLTALTHAIKNNHLECVKLLIEQGADVNKVNLVEDDGVTSRLTPLFYATRLGNPHIVNALIQAGADVRHDFKNGLTALHIVASKNDEDLDIARLLLDNGADVNARYTDIKSIYISDRDSTPLNDAIQNTHTNLIRLLVERGADMNKVTSDMSAVMTAVYDGEKSDILNILIPAGAPLDTKGYLGSTALHIAASQNKTWAVVTLLSAGADRTILNDDGQTALDLAEDPIIIRLLSAAAGGRRKTRRRKGRKSNTRRRHTKS
jgi:ankyrin repeat protein